MMLLSCPNYLDYQMMTLLLSRITSQRCRPTAEREGDEFQAGDARDHQPPQPVPETPSLGRDREVDRTRHRPRQVVHSRQPARNERTCLPSFSI